ncbi:MAG: thiamine pyrophosphate-dependent enzyme [Sulfolobales archaeon]
MSERFRLKEFSKIALASQYEGLESVIRIDRMPHIFCPGCGLGIVLKGLAEAILKSGIPVEKHVGVSGIGCTGRLPGYLRIDAYHVTHGRAIPFAIGLKLANPALEVTVVGGDGDIVTIGGNHFIHAARRNHDINVVIVNNFIYGMTGGQYGATTPVGSLTTTSPYGHLEYSFNIPLLAYASGATFIARWTPLHYAQMVDAFLQMFEHKGFAVVEIVAPCVLYGERNQFPSYTDMLKYFRDRCIIDHGADLRRIGISLEKTEPLVLGNFYKARKKTYEEMYRELVEKISRGGGRE